MHLTPVSSLHDMLPSLAVDLNPATKHSAPAVILACPIHLFAYTISYMLFWMVQWTRVFFSSLLPISTVACSLLFRSLKFHHWGSAHPMCGCRLPILENLCVITIASMIAVESLGKHKNAFEVFFVLIGLNICTG